MHVFEILGQQQNQLPIFVSTWEWGENCSRNGKTAAYNWGKIHSFDLIPAYDLYVNEGLPLLDSVEIGMSVACELNFCADGVGPYGKVNEDGDITQDAMLMDG